MERQLQLNYQTLVNEETNEKSYIVSSLVFSDQNMMCRFGEFLAVMNDLDHFYVYNVESDCVTGVNLLPFDDGEAEEDNKEDMVEDRNLISYNSLNIISFTKTIKQNLKIRYIKN